jgi:hypothetical protein
MMHPLSSHQGEQDDDMNVMYLLGSVTLIRAFELALLMAPILCSDFPVPVPSLQGNSERAEDEIRAGIGYWGYDVSPEVACQRPCDVPVDFKHVLFIIGAMYIHLSCFDSAYSG